MTRANHVILCGGAPNPRCDKSDEIIRLDLIGDEANADLEITDISRRLASDVPDVLTDLIEIATYVYCADQAVTRGGEGVLAFGKNWRRHYHFHIPVRKPNVWLATGVRTALQKTLSFLSEDEYAFDFTLKTKGVPLQQYLNYGDGHGTAPSAVDEVLLFSGGLDSLAGAVMESVQNRKQVALVSHRSNPKIAKRQLSLVEALRDFCPKDALLHIPVWAHQRGIRTREYTQRSRSFLYACMAFAVARVFRLSRIRFYENGPVSLNLPISEQAIGARATRTTHPQTLGNFATLFSLLAEQPFVVENPFLWTARAEVVNVIGDAGCAELIRASSSCMHTREQTIEKSHCGQCSQCIGRRFATLASRYAADDPADMYKVDLLEGPRDPDKDLTLVESFIRTAFNIKQMTDVEVIELYAGEMARVLRHVPALNSDQVAENIIQLHRTHAREVSAVIQNAVGRSPDKILEQRLPATCAIILALPDIYRTATRQPRRLPPRSTGPSLATRADQPKMPYSKTDDQIYSMIGEANFQNFTNRALQIQYLPRIKQVLKRPVSVEACRASFNRIRRYWRLPTSEDIQKNRSTTKASSGQ